MPTCLPGSSVTGCSALRVRTNWTPMRSNAAKSAEPTCRSRPTRIGDASVNAMRCSGRTSSPSCGRSSQIQNDTGSTFGTPAWCPSWRTRGNRARDRSISMGVRTETYEWLKAHIVSLPRDKGVFLTESEVAKAAGASRTPVREALMRLESEGLVERIPQRGAYVPPLSDPEVRSVMDARGMVELWSVERALQSEGAVDLAGLDELLEQQEHTSELQSRGHLVCRLLLEKKNSKIRQTKDRKEEIDITQQQ